MNDYQLVREMPFVITGGTNEKETITGTLYECTVACMAIGRGTCGAATQSGK